MTVIEVRLEPALGVGCLTNANCFIANLEIFSVEMSKLVGLSASAIVMEIRQYS